MRRRPSWIRRQRFDAGRAAAGTVAARIEKGMAATLGVSARVTVLTGADFAAETAP